MIELESKLTPQTLAPRLDRLLSLATDKIRGLAKRWDPASGAPVLTVGGRYATRNWADWTLGFHFGRALLTFEASGDHWLLDWARHGIRRWMPPHITNHGGHDHGFTIVSSYGNLLRLAHAGRFDASADEFDLYRLALRASGAVQANRWTPLWGGDRPPGAGYIYSFHGRHSLFADSIRSLRALALAHQLGHYLMGESDRHINLLERLVRHASSIARYCVYYGEGRDRLDVRGRVAHECIFNAEDGSFRCTTTQQGFSPRSTWTRALAWVILGFAEQLEYLRSCPDAELDPLGGREAIAGAWRRAAQSASDYYLEIACSDGIPYWDTAAPGLDKLQGNGRRASDPFNDIAPVDSSAAVAAAQGLWRLGAVIGPDSSDGARYREAALRTAETLFSPPYLSEDPEHEGLLLHAHYNFPGGWDSIPPGHSTPFGESVMWGDYHALELALLLRQSARGEQDFHFFDI